MITMPSDWREYESGMPGRTVLMTDVDQKLPDGQMRPIRLRLVIEEGAADNIAAHADVVRVGGPDTIFGPFEEDL